MPIKRKYEGLKLVHAPKKGKLTFYGMGWCLTQDNKISRTYYHGSNREMVTSQTKMKQNTDTHIICVKGTHKGNVFSTL